MATRTKTPKTADPQPQEVDSRLRVFSLIPQKYNASFHYRVVLPLATMEDLKLPVVSVIDDGDQTIEHQNRLIAFSYSDINLLYQPVSWGALSDMRRLNALGPGRTKDGQWRWPPTFVVDTDDNLFHVNPLNPVYRTLGMYGPDGKILRKGDAVKIELEGGEHAVLWKDGEKGFDIERNRGSLECYRHLAREASGVTCSTTRVEKYIKEETEHSNTFVFPNSIRFDWYPQVELREHPGEVRILWQGSPTHYEDLYPLAEAMGKVARKYPQTKWYFWGAQYRYVTSRIPADQLVVMQWSPYGEYRLRLSIIGHDINLCPLVDSPFNQSRSAIKWYESSAISRPAATLAQNTATFGDEIEDEATGLLFNDTEDFETRLSGLIEDEKLRHTLASNAKDWMKTHRDALKTVPKLYEFYCGLRRAREVASPPPKHGAPHMERLEFNEEEAQVHARRLGLAADHGTIPAVDADGNHGQANDSGVGGRPRRRRSRPRARRSRARSSD